jgi:hypothetical protein
MALTGGPQALTGYPTNLPIRRFPAFVLVAVSRKSVRRFLVLMRAILYGSEKVLSVMGIFRQLRSLANESDVLLLIHLLDKGMSLSISCPDARRRGGAGVCEP